MNLRPYQNEAKDAIFREWNENRSRTLLVLPTGTGKTIVFAKLIEDCVRAGERVLILAHRGELLQQATDKLSQATGLICAIEKADSTCLDSFLRVVVGSVQSLQRPKRLEQFPKDFFDVIIVDEAHHVLADGYQRVLDHFDKARVLGVTATPDRGDMRDLGHYFDSLAYEYTLPQAIRDGFLCPIKALSIPLNIDLREVKQQAGDFQVSALGGALEPYLHQIADEMKVHCQGRKTVVFLPLIATSQRFCELLKERGFRAVEVNGNSENRDSVQSDFEAGKYDVICNAMLYTEGWDCPMVDCIICLRPTKIRSLYAQITGRGTRIYPGKDHLLLLDFLWLSDRHELCRPAHLIAESSEIAAKMTENIAAAGGPVDIEDAERQAECDCQAEREEALAKKLAACRNRKRKLVDPLQFEMSIGAEDLAGYVPSFGWEMEPPSEVQRKQLEVAGISPDEIENAGKAEAIIQRIMERRRTGLATPKQIRFLEGKGFQHVGKWDFDHARRMIDRIAASSWRLPQGIDPSTYQPPKREVIVTV